MYVHYFIKGYMKDNTEVEKKKAINNLVKYSSE